MRISLTHTCALLAFILGVLCRSLVLAGCLDEIFLRGRAVLVGVEPVRMTWFVGRRTDRLDGRAWADALVRFPMPRYVVADAGASLQAGIELVRRGRAARGQTVLDSNLDVFHTKYEAREALGAERRREEQAAAAYEAADMKLERAKRQGVPAQAAANRGRAAWRTVEAAIQRREAVEAAWAELACALEIFRPDGRLNSRA